MGMERKDIKKLEEVYKIIHEKYTKGLFDQFLIMLKENKLKSDTFEINRQYLFAYIFYKNSNNAREFCKELDLLFKTKKLLNPLILKKTIIMLRPFMDKQIVRRIGLFSFFKEINEKYNLKI